MRTKITSLFFFGLLFLCLNNGYSQISVGTKVYSSTPAFTFSQNGGGLNSFSPVNVLVGKRNSSDGLIMISMPSFEGRLKKGLMIYLDDGTVISCTDRNLFDEVDNETMGVWYLTSSEIIKMKNSDISTIRYTLHWHGIEYKAFTASNKYNNPYDNDPFPKSTSTTYYIKKLFKGTSII
jgi:hypothetical protein